MLTYKELQKLFIKIKQGDGQAFKDLFENTYRSQYFIAFNYINDRYLAEEAVQNMYITLYNHIDSIKNSMAIIKWMNTTTINECKRLIRTEKLNDKVNIDNFEDKLADKKPDPETSYKKDAQKDILNAALNKMDTVTKQIIIYRYVDNLKVKDIAKLTGLSTSTINRDIKNGTEELKMLLEEEEED